MTSTPPAVRWTDYDAWLFDLDGVLTPTAEVHMRAWAQMFSAFLTDRGVNRPYDKQDYFAYIDGKPRNDGVRSFLASRDIVLPEGDATDDPQSDTVCGLGARKNASFSAMLTSDGVQAYPGSVALLDLLAARGTTVAVVSSSRNAPAVLKAAGLADRFEVVVDGTVVDTESLAGKPSPATYLYAANRVKADIARAVVVEDAISGVEAGRDGHFGLVVGVDRGAGADELRAAGADVVVADLAELVPR